MLYSKEGTVKLSGNMDDLMVEYSMLTCALLEEANPDLLLASILTAVEIHTNKQLEKIGGFTKIDMSKLKELRDMMDKLEIEDDNE